MGVFRHADNVDKLLLLFGTLGSIGDGLMTPLTLTVISGLMNDISISSQSVSTFDAAPRGDQVSVHTFLSFSLLAVVQLMPLVDPLLDKTKFYPRLLKNHFRYLKDADKTKLPISMRKTYNELLLRDISSQSQADKYQVLIGKLAFFMVAVKLLCISVGVAVSGFVEGVCWTRTAERQTSRMRMQYLKSVLRQEVAFFDSHTASPSSFHVISGITIDAEKIQDVISEKIPQFLSNTATCIACFIISFTLSWRLALYTFPLILLFLVPMLGLGKVMMGVGSKMKEAYGVAGEIAEQAISSIRMVYSFVGEQQTLIRFNQALDKYTELGIKQGLTKGLLMGSMGMIYINFSFQSWIGGILVAEKGENGGNIFIAGLCVLMGGVQLMTSLSSISFFIEAKVAATRINEMIGRVTLIDSEDEKGKTLEKVRGSIEFKNIDFCYPSRPDNQILKKFSLTAKAGETVGLVGSSGSGKSTIISLLERFYDPVKGDILMDGYNIQTLQLKWLRAQMGLVSQEPILFATSIKENILFGKEEATMDHVLATAKAANAHNFIAKLPQGYDTDVGQFGLQLSGGQRQRIAIARALLRDPKILLLDEATSALDAHSEKIVQDALDKASVGRTTIIIAHCLSTIQDANNIVVVESGVVLESGTHDELMQNKNGQGAYFKMVQLQQSATMDDTHDSFHSPSDVVSNRKLRSSHASRGERLRLQSSPTHVHDSYTKQIFSSEMQRQVANNKGENLEKKSSTSTYQLRLLKMSAPEWKMALLGCIGAIGVGAIQVAISYLLGLLVSIYWYTDKEKIKSETRVQALLFMILGVLGFITNVLQHYDFAVMGERLTKKVRENMLQKLLTFEVGWFDRDENTSAAISARLATEANIVKSLIGDRISLVLQVFTTVFLSYSIGLIVVWRLAIVMIAMQPLLIACMYSRIILLKKMSEKAKKAQAEASQLASEATTNHRTITAFSSHGRILNLFAISLDHPRKENIAQSWLSGFGLFTSLFLNSASVTMTFWYGFRLINNGLIEPKPFFQAFFLLMSTSQNVADAGSMTSDLSKGISAVISLFAVLDRKTEIEPDESHGIKAEGALKGEIELKDVFFSYPSRPDQMILKGLNLKISAGKTFALVGKSGSGKSTTIGLIERFYEPLDGSIFIDNQNIKSYNLRSLRSHIALVSQEPTLFAGTIRQNILYGKEEATDSELIEATTMANAHFFISSMKDGYDTYCGERGVQLSGGQKQRIALARAILKNPTILLLDEATSALDSESEHLVQEALEKMMVGRTSVVVAHHLSTIRKSDTIVVINNGNVVEQGSHSELLAAGQGGAYYSLVNLQNNHHNK